MATPIAMPRQGQSVESCIISQWSKKQGDQVKEGDLLFTFETDKASFEFNSPVSGTLLEIFAQEGDDVPVLTNVAVIGNAGEDVSSFRPAGAVPEAPAIQSSAAHAETPSTALSSIPSAYGGMDGQEQRISPRARNLAQSEMLDTVGIQGTGPQGRVIERDVRAALSSAPMTKTARAMAAASGTVPSSASGIGGRISAADFQAAPQSVPTPPPMGQTEEIVEVKLSTIRKIIADRMVQSLRDAAQLTMHISAQATELLAFRAKVKAAGEALGLENITINDLVAFAVARTLPRFTDLNAHFAGDKILKFRDVHLAMAMDSPKGLMVPVVRSANHLSLNGLARQLKELATQCQQGAINPDLLSGGTFTISNLGAFGIESFTPVLNLPQVALLGVNTISPKPISGKNGECSLAPHIGLSLTIDHRAVDGAPAARFLKALKETIENFSLVLSL